MSFVKLLKDYIDLKVFCSVNPSEYIMDGEDDVSESLMKKHKEMKKIEKQLLEYDMDLNKVNESINTINEDVFVDGTGNEDVFVDGTGTVVDNTIYSDFAGVDIKKEKTGNPINSYRCEIDWDEVEDWHNNAKLDKECDIKVKYSILKDLVNTHKLTINDALDNIFNSAKQEIIEEFNKFEDEDE